MKKIAFGKPVLGKEEFNNVLKVLKTGIYVHGPKSEEFEKRFKKFTKAKYAISVSSCTAGMHLAYFSQGYGPGDEIIVPAQTHVATAHAIELTGAKPVFVDSDTTTGNIDVSKIEKAITGKTKAISIVHFLGVPVDMNKVMKIAKKFKLFVLEDCALSLGSKIKDTHVGLFGDVGVFSFYPAKHMTTGEGGMVITNNRKLADKIRLQKAFGVNRTFSKRKIPGMYDVVQLGFNYRMSEIHAAIGLEQIKKVPLFLKKRLENYKNLSKFLAKSKPIKILAAPINKLSSSHYCLCVVLDDSIYINRTEIIKKLNNQGIGCSIYYPQPVPRMTYYKKKYKYDEKKYKNACRISDQSIALPVGPHLGLKEMKYIAKNLNGIIQILGNKT